MGNSDLRAWATTLLRVVVGVVFTSTAARSFLWDSHRSPDSSLS
jgi:hypothetical protein